MASELATSWKSAKTAAEKELKKFSKDDSVTAEMPRLKDDFQKNLDKTAKFEAEIEKRVAELKKLCAAWEQQCATTAKVSDKYLKEFQKMDTNSFGNKRSLRQTVMELPIRTLTSIKSQLTQKQAEAKQLKGKLG